MGLFRRNTNLFVIDVEKAEPADIRSGKAVEHLSSDTVRGQEKIWPSLTDNNETALLLMGGTSETFQRMIPDKIYVETTGDVKDELLNSDVLRAMIAERIKKYGKGGCILIESDHLKRARDKDFGPVIRALEAGMAGIEGRKLSVASRANQALANTAPALKG